MARLHLLTIQCCLPHHRGYHRHLILSEIILIIIHSPFLLTIRPVHPIIFTHIQPSGLHGILSDTSSVISQITSIRYHDLYHDIICSKWHRLFVFSYFDLEYTRSCHGSPDHHVLSDLKSWLELHLRELHGKIDRNCDAINQLSTLISKKRSTKQVSKWN